MPHGSGKDGLGHRFVELLARTLDVRRAIDELGITDERARAILLGLIGAGDRREKGADAVAGVYDIFVDGASRGNPGEAGAGALIMDAHGHAVKKLKKYLGVKTNNVAEYSAMIIALEAARSMGIASIRVHADSELMVKQINGEYRVKSPDLKPLYDRVVELLGSFTGHRVVHIYREKNAVADALANEAIDRGRHD